MEQIFDRMQERLKCLKKRAYQERMAEFRSENESIFSGILSAVQTAGHSEDVARRAADDFVGCVERRFSDKRGKIGARLQADLNLYMVYFVFPAILLTGSPCAGLLCQAIQEQWSARFPNGSIGCMDYETICGSFHEKIFGIF